MAILRIENLTKDYVGGLGGKRFRALTDLNLEVEEGEIFGFLGPNGAGKTTTIKILLRIIFPTSGNAWICDTEISRASHMHRIGYMPENPYFYRFLTGFEFLMFYAKLTGVPVEDAKKKADELLHVVGLEHAKKTRISDYSKGMVTRVGLAQALITNPVLLLLDEPMSGLDPIGRREIRDLIIQLKEEKKTIFFCSHILADVEMLCDRIAILNKGNLVKQGTVSDILSESQAKFVLVLDRPNDDVKNQLTSKAEDHSERSGLVYLTAPNEETGQDMLKQAMSMNARIVEYRQDRGTLEDYFVREVGTRE